MDIRPVGIPAQGTYTGFTPQTIGSTTADPAPVTDSVQSGQASEKPAIDLKKAASELFGTDTSNAVKRSYSPCDHSGYGAPAVQGSDGVLYAAGGKTIVAMEGNTGNMRWERSVRGSLSSPPVVAPDNKTAYFTAHNGSLTAVDSVTGDQKWEKYEGGFKWFTPPAVTGDGASIYAGSMGKFVGKMDASTGEYQWKFDLPSAVKATPTLSPDEKTLFVEAENHTLYAFDTQKGEPRWILDLGMGFNTQAPVSSDGSQVFSANWDKEIFGVNTEDGSKTWTYKWDKEASWNTLKLQLSPDGRNLAALVSYREDSGKDTQVNLIMLDATTGNEKWVYENAGLIQPAFSPDGKSIIAVDKKRSLHALDAETGKVTWDYTSSLGDIIDPSISRDGNTVFASVKWHSKKKGDMLTCASRMIAVNARTGKEIPEFKPHGIMTQEFEQDSGQMVYRRKKIDIATISEDASSSPAPVIEQNSHEVEIDGAKLKKRKSKF